MEPLKYTACTHDAVSEEQHTTVRLCGRACDFDLFMYTSGRYIHFLIGAWFSLGPPSLQCNGSSLIIYAAGGPLSSGS